MVRVLDSHTKSPLLMSTSTQYHKLQWRQNWGYSKIPYPLSHWGLGPLQSAFATITPRKQPSQGQQWTASKRNGYFSVHISLNLSAVTSHLSTLSPIILASASSCLLLPSQNYIPPPVYARVPHGSAANRPPRQARPDLRFHPYQSHPRELPTDSFHSN